jgi:hypothetical protein
MRSSAAAMLVAWIERSEIRGDRAAKTLLPGFAPLNPGYDRYDLTAAALEY